MAHELTITNGMAEMAYIGKTPWHGLGQKLDDGADLDQWRIAAGMDWDILQAPALFHNSTNGLMQSAPSHKILHRSDNSSVLGVVGSKYQVVQPREVLGFFADLVDTADFKMETAGTLFGGKKFWALASIGDSVSIGNRDDKVGGYLLLSTAADGSMATTARFTTVRVVCNNTLGMSLREGKPEVSVRHSTAFNADVVKRQLGLAHDAFATFADTAQRLAEVEMSVADANNIVTTALKAAGMITQAADKESRAQAQIIDLFTGSAIGYDMAGRTGWGLINAVTQYTDHHARATTPSNRLASAWFGRGDALKVATMQQLVQLAA